MEGVVVMKKEEIKIYRLAQEVFLGKLSIREFSTLIQKSYRQAQRIIKKTREKDYLGVIHGNAGRTPINKTPQYIQEQVLELLKTKYYDFNLTHFKEQIIVNEGISLGKNVIHRLAKKNGLIKRPKRRARKVHHPRPRMPKEGMLVQFDGSPHQWIGTITCDLIAAIDDATSKVLAAEFFIGETSLHSMTVLREVIEKHGVPEAFYMDASALFGKQDRDWETQVGRALEDMGSRIIIAGSAQAKGRVERLFGTLQDRLIAELRLNNIKSIPAANEFLKKDFISRFNKKFSVEPKEKSNAYKPIPLCNLSLVFCRKEKRKIGPGNTFSWRSETWFLQEDKDYRYRSININTHLDGSISFDIIGKKVSATKIEQKLRKIAA